MHVYRLYVCTHITDFTDITRLNFIIREHWCPGFLVTDGKCHNNVILLFANCFVHRKKCLSTTSLIQFISLYYRWSLSYPIKWIGDGNRRKFTPKVLEKRHDIFFFMKFCGMFHPCLSLRPAGGGELVQKKNMSCVSIFSSIQNFPFNKRALTVT